MIFDSVFADTWLDSHAGLPAQHQLHTGGALGCCLVWSYRQPCNPDC